MFLFKILGSEKLDNTDTYNIYKNTWNSQPLYDITPNFLKKLTYEK